MWSNSSWRTQGWLKSYCMKKNLIEMDRKDRDMVSIGTLLLTQLPLVGRDIAEGPKHRLTHSKTQQKEQQFKGHLDYNNSTPSSKWAGNFQSPVQSQRCWTALLSTPWCSPWPASTLDAATLSRWPQVWCSPGTASRPCPLQFQWPVKVTLVMIFLWGLSVAC